MLCMWAVTYRIQEKLIVCSYIGKNVILNRACIYNNILWVVIMLEYCLLFGNIECGNEWFRYTSLNATDCQPKKVRNADIFMSLFDTQKKNGRNNVGLSRIFKAILESYFLYFIFN